MATDIEVSQPVLPFPISRISATVERYLLYDADVVTWLRKTYHILGVLVGTLPQIPQQNVFLGLPLELMPEEAKLLSEWGIAYIVDDNKWHHDGMQLVSQSQKDAYMHDLAVQGREAAKAAERKKLENTERAMRKLRLSSTPDRENMSSVRNRPDAGTIADPVNEEPESLFDAPSKECDASDSSSRRQSSIRSADQWTVTPTTSYPPLPRPPVDPAIQNPTVKTSSYALFKHLHSRDYFMSPGLRFGCQFLVYPGDPLRFHSHFLAVSAGWDEELDLMDIIGGGRLGTGVKKGWLIGGMDKHNKGNADRTPDGDLTQNERVRTFCIEWSGM